VGHVYIVREDTISEKTHIESIIMQKELVISRVESGPSFSIRHFFPLPFFLPSQIPTPSLTLVAKDDQRPMAVGQMTARGSQIPVVLWSGRERALMMEAETTMENTLNGV
jgi:hypothetical protein